MDKYAITFKTWDKIAELYQEKFMDLDLYNDSYDALCDLLSDNASVLELGRYKTPRKSQTISTPLSSVAKEQSVSWLDETGLAIFI